MGSVLDAALTDRLSGRSRSDARKKGPNFRRWMVGDGSVVRVKCKVAPPPVLGSTHSFPPRASIIDRQIQREH